MKIENYLDRIQFQGEINLDLDCLRRIHFCHALHVPYENLDVQLERPMSIDAEPAYDKIVTHNRGGWCYEQNGLLAWALSEIGFSVTRCTGAVDRREMGDDSIGNHLVLLVQLDQPYICDLGIGDAIRMPIPMCEGLYQQGKLEFHLELLDDGFWRFRNHALASPGSFDFLPGTADEDRLSARCHHLQTSPDSNFVQNLICMIMQENSVTSLTGCVLCHQTLTGTTKKLITSPAELVGIMNDVFGIVDPAIESIWPRVFARHHALFGDQPVNDIDVTSL